MQLIFPEYTQYFGIALKLLKSMYGMTNSGKLFADDLTEWLIKEGLCSHNVRCQSTNNQTFTIEYPKDGEPVTPCMDVYKAKIQSDGSLDKLKLRIVVRGDLQNKEMIGDTWSPT